MTDFTPLVKGLSFTLSTTDKDGKPLPEGEVESAATIGIRPDGDATNFPVGTYKYTVVLDAGVTSVTPSEIAAKLRKPLPPGNYWAAVDQTDVLNGSPATSPWTAEIPFSIPQPVVQPSPPTGFTAA